MCKGLAEVQSQKCTVSLYHALVGGRIPRSSTGHWYHRTVYFSTIVRNASSSQLKMSDNQKAAPTPNEFVAGMSSVHANHILHVGANDCRIAEGNLPYLAGVYDYLLRWNYRNDHRSLAKFFAQKFRDSIPFSIISAQQEISTLAQQKQLQFSRQEIELAIYEELAKYMVLKREKDMELLYATKPRIKAAVDKVKRILDRPLDTADYHYESGHTVVKVETVEGDGVKLRIEDMIVTYSKDDLQTNINISFSNGT